MLIKFTSGGRGGGGAVCSYLAKQTASTTHLVQQVNALLKER